MYFAVLGIINYNQSADFNKNSGNNARKKKWCVAWSFGFNQEIAGLVTFTEEILNGQLHFVSVQLFGQFANLEHSLAWKTKVGQIRVITPEENVMLEFWLGTKPYERNMVVSKRTNNYVKKSSILYVSFTKIYRLYDSLGVHFH